MLDDPLFGYINESILRPGGGLMWDGVGVPAMVLHVIENVPASNQVPRYQHSTSTLLIFCVRTVFLPIFTYGHVY